MRRALRHVLTTRPLLVWAGVIGGATALDVWADRNDIIGDSLSECLRATLHTDTPLGQATFIAGWSALSAWFIPHICRGPRERK